MRRRAGLEAMKSSSVRMRWEPLKWSTFASAWIPVPHALVARIRSMAACPFGSCEGGGGVEHASAKQQRKRAVFIGAQLT